MNTAFVLRLVTYLAASAACCFSVGFVASCNVQRHFEQVIRIRSLHINHPILISRCQAITPRIAWRVSVFGLKNSEKGDCLGIDYLRRFTLDSVHLFWASDLGFKESP